MVAVRNPESSGLHATSDGYRSVDWYSRIVAVLSPEASGHATSDLNFLELWLIHICVAVLSILHATSDLKY